MKNDDRWEDLARGEHEERERVRKERRKQRGPGKGKGGYARPQGAPKSRRAHASAEKAWRNDATPESAVSTVGGRPEE